MYDPQLGQFLLPYSTRFLVLPLFLAISHHIEKSLTAYQGTDLQNLKELIQCPRSII